MLVGSIYKAGELELTSILMLKDANKFHNGDACLRYLASKYPLCKSNQMAYTIRMTVAYPNR